MPTHEENGLRRYGVRDLIRELVDAPWLLRDHTPDYPSALARRRRAEILASELGLDLLQLEDGKFLHGDKRRRPELHALLMRHAGERVGQTRCDEAFAFKHLWSFRRDAAALLRHNAGFLEASGEYFGLIHMTSVGHRLDEMFEDVDTALGLLLDPEQRSIEEATLLARGWVTDRTLQKMELEEF